MALIGWGDESGSDETRDPGTYLLSVVLADSDDATMIQEAMQALRHKSTRKLHWRDEPSDRRERIVQAIAELPAAGLVVVRSDPLSTDLPERRRRKCLEHLLPGLVARGCHHLTLESRGTKDDQRDRRMLEHLRRAHRLEGGKKLHMDHVPGPRDAGLWAADAVCGAMVCGRVGDPRDYLATITAGITIEVITV